MRITIHVKIDQETVELVTIGFVPFGKQAPPSSPSSPPLLEFSDFPTLRAFIFQEMNKARRERGKSGLPIGQRNDWDFVCRSAANDPTNDSAHWEWRCVVKPEHSRTTTKPPLGRRSKEEQSEEEEEDDQKLHRKRPRRQPIGFWQWVMACRRRPTHLDDDGDDSDEEEDEEEDKAPRRKVLPMERKRYRGPSNKQDGKIPIPVKHGKSVRGERARKVENEEEEEDEEESVSEAFATYPRSKYLESTDEEEEEELVRREKKKKPAKKKLH